jgi:hypothetical protein
MVAKNIAEIEFYYLRLIKLHYPRISIARAQQRLKKFKSKIGLKHE